MNLEAKLSEYIILKKNKIKISSKDIKKGDVFIALKGKKNHGNKFIEAAIKNGAKFCLTDKRNFKQNSKVCYVKDIFEYLKDLAIKKRELYQGKVVGITGSAGKTTLKETLAYFLKKNYIISYSQKSYNNELGVLVSILNLNLNSKFSIFEIGTNNFNEIKYLTKIVKPEEIFITNIQSTHLENFKTKKNIALEKSDIFISKFNSVRNRLYLNISNEFENYIYKRAKNEKKLKIIKVNKFSKKYFIKKIINKNDYNKVILSINKKIINIHIKSVVIYRLINLLFCYAFFVENSLDINTITHKQKYLRPVSGRGLQHIVSINKKRVKIIDESYNANPDTMIQSINYFRDIKEKFSKKILILGNMNELGSKTNSAHLSLLKEIDKNTFKFVILCGEFFRRSVNKLNKPKNEIIYFNNQVGIMEFLNKKVHNNDIILIKCSNSTEINKFTKGLIKNR